jgi:hypothetical protein
MTVHGDCECDWGVIEYGDPDPYLDQVGHLMLITPDYVKQLLSHPTLYPPGSVSSAYRSDDRTFVELLYENKRWTWELFEAHWWDGEGPEIYIGRWPD